MFLRSKKAVLAIEWSWLLIGTAVVFAHMMETWARPYLPSVWMMGVLVLFVGYRFAVSFRELHAPAPPVEPQSQAEAAPVRYDREGAKGMVSTTEWVPPHIRGRRRRPEEAKGREAGQAQAEADEKLELPSASGKFDGSEIATVFAEVDEETDPLGTDIVDLRPETQEDITASTTGELSIPSFAESTMTIRERQEALEVIRGRVGADADKTQDLVSEADKTQDLVSEADKTQDIAEEADKTFEIDVSSDEEAT